MNVNQPKKDKTMSRHNLEAILELLKPVELPPLSAYPFVSVLTPNYNYARYLPEAIESVLAQTYRHFEMIVCDDGSSDESCAIAKRYVQQDSRIKLVSKENGGATSAVNAAYRESSGDIVCLLDADDRYLPYKLETVVRGFRANPECGFLGHRMFRITVDGRRCGVTSLLDEHPSGWYGPFIVRYGDIPGLAIASGLCFRKEIGKLLFPQPEILGNYGEAAITALAPLMTPLIGTSEPLAEYRCHGRNDSNGRVTLKSVDRGLEVHKMKWELQREYLASVNANLAEIFSGCDRRSGTLISTYIHSRLEPRGEVSGAYRNLVLSEGFQTLHPAIRLFWSLSILLPRPLFRSVLDGVWGPGCLKALAWRIIRYLSNGKSQILSDGSADMGYQSEYARLSARAAGADRSVSR
jgi:glycosyltransferase involved in cell wall biosynthesis